MLENHRAGQRWFAIAIILLISLGQNSLAQSSADQTRRLTLAEAVDFALKNYPAVRASLERVTAAQAGVGLVAENDVMVASQAASADQGQVQSAENNVAAARDALRSVAQLESYLNIHAPFDGIVTVWKLAVGTDCR